MLPKFREIRIENTNACGYRCTMCPREKQTRPLGYMSLEDFDIVLRRVGAYESYVHLHGFGEPLLDRSLVPKIKRLKEKWPRCFSIIFSTLGVKIPDFQEIAASGLDQLNVSFYGFSRIDYTKIHGVDRFEKVKENLALLSRAIRETRSSLKVYVKIPSPNLTSALPVAFPEEGRDLIERIQDFGFELALWPQVHNYGDGREFNKPGGDLLCPVIEGGRKHILNITWDLNVIPCCFDFNATIRFGNLRNSSLEEIFSGPDYLKFVIAHRSKATGGYPVCENCEKNDCIV